MCIIVVSGTQTPQKLFNGQKGQFQPPEGVFGVERAVEPSWESVSGTFKQNATSNANSYISVSSTPRISNWVSYRKLIIKCLVNDKTEKKLQCQ